MKRDVVIIGGGPAGSLAATLLARAGLDVTLIEQARFPRDKVCGESLSALGIEVLERAGLAERLRDAGAVELRRTGLFPCEGDGASIALPRPMWGLSRRVMDAILLDVAREAGANVLQPARCERIAPRVVVRDLGTNHVSEVDASLIVLADGKGALLASKPKATGDLGVKAHFVDAAAPRDAVELYGVRGHYIGVAAIEGARWNVAMSVPAARVARCGDLDQMWAELLAENKTLAARFKGATRAGDWLASPLPRFAVRRDWQGGVIPIGNAVAAVEPIGGEGMGLALRSAQIVADGIIGGSLNVATLRREFAQLWTIRRAACRSLAKVLGSPALAPDIVDWARGSEGLARTVLRLIGK